MFASLLDLCQLNRWTILRNDHYS